MWRTDLAMKTTRERAIRALLQEARDLRVWADAQLAEPARIEPYLLAGRLERIAREMADEPVWLRVGGDVKETTRALIGSAQRGLKRRAS